ncbi:MAG: DNA cytosine methyltransferase [bacterium]
MRVLDLFAGLGGFSQAFRDRRHEVVTLDKDPRFKPDVQADIREVRFPGLPPMDRRFDVVLASPPCEAFSVASIPRYWVKSGEPKDDAKVTEGLSFVSCALALIAGIRPRFWIMENPSGMLKTVLVPPTQTVHLCNFGAPWQKRTDLWGRWPGGDLDDPWPCAPHEAAPRGSRKGVQGVRDPAERAKLPYGLGEELCKRMENHG